MLEAKIEDGHLLLKIPLKKEPVKSTSGKSVVIASTHGNQKTECRLNGQVITVGVNAFIPLS